MLNAFFIVLAVAGATFVLVVTGLLWLGSLRARKQRRMISKGDLLVSLEEGPKARKLAHRVAQLLQEPPSTDAVPPHVQHAMSDLTLLAVEFQHFAQSFGQGANNSGGQGESGQRGVDLLRMSDDPDAAQAASNLTAALDSLFRTLGAPPDSLGSPGGPFVPTQGGGAQT